MYYGQKYNIRIGDDKTIVVPIRDKETGLAVDVSKAKDIIVNVSYKNQSFAVYRLVIPLNSTEYDGTVGFTTQLDEISIDLKNITTRHFVVGKFDITVSLYFDELIWETEFLYNLDAVVWNEEKQAYYKCIAAHTSDIFEIVPSDFPEWVTAAAYAVEDLVYDSVADKYYRCNETHISGDAFADDLSKWNEVFSDIDTKWDAFTGIVIFDKKTYFNETFILVCDNINKLID